MSLSRKNRLIRLEFGLMILVGMFAQAGVSVSASANSLDPVIASAVADMHRELSLVNFHSGRTTITPYLFVSGERDEQTVVRYTVATGVGAARLSYEPEKVPSSLKAGRIVTRLEIPQVRYYDSTGAAIVKGGRAERLSADYQVSNWMGRELFVFSPSLVTGRLASVEGFASASNDLELPDLNTDAHPDDRYVLCPPAENSVAETEGATDSFTGKRRSIRFAKKYAYRPDLILVMSRSGGIVRDVWRLDWQQVSVDNKLIWFPSRIHRQSIDPTKSPKEGAERKLLYTVDIETDLHSVSSAVPVSLIGPVLPPAPKIPRSTTPLRTVTSEEMSRDLAERLRSRKEPRDAELPVVSKIETTSGTPGISVGWRTIIVSSVVIAGIVLVRLTLPRWRRVERE